jgi:hypothetical protein
MTTHEDRLTAALVAADKAHRAAQTQAEAAHAAIAEKAAEALQEAVDRHDATVGEADRILHSKTARAEAARAQAEEQAWAEFDAAMREQYDEPDAKVVVNRAGALELRVGRTRMGGVVLVATDSYRVDGLPGGFVFVPSPVIARRLLWSTLQPDQEEPAVVA